MPATPATMIRTSDPKVRSAAEIGRALRLADAPEITVRVADDGDYIIVGDADDLTFSVVTASKDLADTLARDAARNDLQVVRGRDLEVDDVLEDGGTVTGRLNGGELHDRLARYTLADDLVVLEVDYQHRVCFASHADVAVQAPRPSRREPCAHGCGADLYRPVGWTGPLACADCQGLPAF